MKTNTNIKTSIALLLLVVAAIWIENLFLKNITLNNEAYDSIAGVMTENKISRCFANKFNGEKIALSQAGIPLYPGAQRLTFDGGNVVRYRLNASSEEAADFYSQKLTAQCWGKNNLAYSKDSEKLTISFDENPITKKTEVTYTFASPENIKVLGIQLAEETGALQPSGEISQPQPPQENFLPAPPPPSDTQLNTQSPPPSDGINYQSQPQIQPYQHGNTDNAGTQTCRVNGVDMPGPCSNYNNIPSTSEPIMEFNRQNSPEMNERQGPSEEEIQKMDEKRFKDMKRGLEQFSRGAKMMKRSLTKMKNSITKCGVNVPAELENALNASDGIVEKIKAAQNADELEEITGDVEDVGAVMQDWGPRMGDLQRLCQMIKQADKDIKQLDRSLKRYEARAKANKKMDLSEITAEYKKDIEALKEILGQVKQLAQTDPDSALEKIEDDFYGQMDNVRNNEMAIDMALNMSQGMRNVDKEIKNYEKQIKSLKRKKIDVKEAEELLNKLKVQIAEIKKFAKGQFDREEFVAKVEAAFDAREELQDALQELGSGPQMEPKITGEKNYNVQINLPDSFKKQKTVENEEDSGDINP